MWGGNRAVSTGLSLPGLDAAVLSRPYHGDAGGGDVHLVSSCGTGRITRLMLADISGHGEAVSELGDRLRQAMQRYMNHIAPHKLAARMNRDMAELADGTSRFATAVVLTYFSPDGGLSLCNAGHPPPMLYRAAERSWQPIDQPDPHDRIENIPLGVLEDAGYEGRDLTLAEGDVVLAYTDCLTEACDPQTDRELGTAGLLEWLQEQGGPDGADIEAWLSGLARQLTEDGYTLEDDLTMVALRSVGTSEGVDSAERRAATGRILKSAWKGESPMPWPELSWLNLGGALLPGVKRQRDGADAGGRDQGP